MAASLCPGHHRFHSPGQHLFRRHRCGTIHYFGGDPGANRRQTFFYHYTESVGRRGLPGLFAQNVWGKNLHSLDRRRPEYFQRLPRGRSTTVEERHAAPGRGRENRGGADTGGGTSGGDGDQTVGCPNDSSTKIAPP